MKAFLKANAHWLGTCAQWVAPIVAAVAVVLAWDAQRSAIDLAVTTLQESDFSRAVENVRHLSDKLADNEDVARGSRCVKYLADLPAPFAEKYFSGEERLFKSGIRNVAEAKIQNKRAFDDLNNELARCLGSKVRSSAADADLIFNRRYTAYLNALSIGVSTWQPIPDQRKLVDEKKRDMREFCYVERNLTVLCNEDGWPARFLERYLKLGPGEKPINDRYPNLVQFHREYCKSSMREDKRRECDQLNKPVTGMTIYERVLSEGSMFYPPP
jgi:hypothetical protein